MNNHYVVHEDVRFWFNPKFNMIMSRPLGVGKWVYVGDLFHEDLSRTYRLDSIDCPIEVTQYRSGDTYTPVLVIGDLEYPIGSGVNIQRKGKSIVSFLCSDLNLSTPQPVENNTKSSFAKNILLVTPHLGPLVARVQDRLFLFHHRI